MRKEQGKERNTSTLQTPVFKQNAYLYNYVNFSQAQSLATGSNFSISGYTTTLPFGLQFDLMLKYLEVKGAVTAAQINSNSNSWGALPYGSYTITNTSAKYTTNYGQSYTSVSSSYTKSSSWKSIIWTTGATAQFRKQNIYDIAGNMWEWTIENDSSGKAIIRGSNHYDNQEAGRRATMVHGDGNDGIGFRVVLCKN